MPSDKFKAALKVVLAFEGGFVNNPADPGGATNYGVTLNVARGFGSMADFDHDGDVDAKDIALMPLSFAEHVYSEKYWNPLYDSMSQALATKVFDMAVNMGPGQAHKLLQRGLCALGLTCAIDGVLGPQTLSLAIHADEAKLLAAVRAAQKNYYLNLIAARPSLAVFQRGWLRRAEA